MKTSRALVVSAAVAGLLVAVGLGAHDLVAAGSPHVQALLAEGQHALARHDTGGAALSFERARLLAPRASSVRAAIDSANLADAEGPLARAVRILTTSEWASIATSFGWIAAIAAAFALAKRSALTARGVALTASAGFVLALAAVVQSNASRPAIVVASPEAHLLVAPYAAAAPASEPSLPAGTMVVPGEMYDGFVHVKTPDGATGWTPRASLDAIAAPAI